MNCSYRSIWNDSTGTFVAVSENARSAGKKTSSGVNATGIDTGFMLQALAVSVMLAFAANALAQPSGGVVAAGAATISAGATSTTINQSTQNAIINWQSFNIASGQSVQFVQPSSSSITLNRVLGSDPSSILGSLSANGKVFLVNPNGILFGQGASVNVGGLLASTLDITNSDFLAGNYRFSGNGTGTVLNQGSLNADGGYVALLGANVSNQGIISAQLGSVVLAAGKVMTMDVAGDGLLNIAVNEGAVNALVQNGGLIRADGGQVLLTTQAAGSLLQNAVNNTGVIQAQTLVTGESGSIMLMGGMAAGTVNVGGTLDASAPNGGNGGFIETSAARVKIADDTLIRTQSAQGQAGTWLIDPVDFTIASIGGDITPGALATALAGNVIISSNDGGAGTNGDINVNNDVTWNAATTLTLNAVNDVNFNAAVTASNGGSLVANAGRDVVVKADVVTGITTTGGNITWTAGQDIQVNSNLAGQTGITATFAAGDSGNITWVAGRDVNINSQVTTTGGDFTVCCGRDIKVNDAVTTTDGNAVLNAGRDIVISAAMITTRGDVLLRAGSEPSAALPGLIGGTVVFAPGILYTVTGPVPGAVTVDYTPTSYATPNDYAGNFTGDGAAALTQHMLVFAQGNDKVYDGNTDATLTFRGDPTVGGTKAVSLVPGTGTFDDKNVAPDIGITYTGYSLGGADAAQFALWGVCGAVAGNGRTSAAITPAPLTITANDASKTYGQTVTLAPTAFTTTALVNGETVGTVTEVSPGTVATAPVAGSPYAITPSAATGGTFTPGNYTIDYVNGALTITPAPLTITANDASKTYGQTLVLPDTAFTTTGLVNGDTVTSVPETSAGTVASAAVVGSPYAITPGTATGTYVPGNYTVSYVDGKLYVLPVVVIPPVVVPPVVAPDVVDLPDTPLELPIVNPPVGPRAWPPVVVLPLIPPQLQTLAPPVVLAPAPVPPPVVAPQPERIEPVAQPAPQPYVAPIRPRKQDRN